MRQRTKEEHLFIHHRVQYSTSQYNLCESYYCGMLYWLLLCVRSLDCRIVSLYTILLYLFVLYINILFTSFRLHVSTYHINERYNCNNQWKQQRDQSTMLGGTGFELHLHSCCFVLQSMVQVWYNCCIMCHLLKCCIMARYWFNSGCRCLQKYFQSRE